MASKYAGRSGRPWRRIVASMRRAGGVCHICGLPIDTNLKAPHPQSFTVDHIAPLSANPHLAQRRDNLAPAHLACNSSKGNRAPTAPTVTSLDW